MLLARPFRPNRKLTEAGHAKSVTAFGHTIRRITSDSFHKGRFCIQGQVTGHDLSAKADASDSELSLRSYAAKAAEKILPCAAGRRGV
jgi:hypothetical protein